MSKRQLEEPVQAAVQGMEAVATSPTLAGKVVVVTGASSGIGRAIALDVAEARDLDALGEDLRRAFGRVDTWVNNAGADVLTGDAARLSWVEKLDRVLAVDLRGTVLASWKAVELMRAQPAGGVILNMSWDHVVA